jgi:hypothetical protein
MKPTVLLFLLLFLPACSQMQNQQSPTPAPPGSNGSGGPGSSINYTFFVGFEGGMDGVTVAQTTLAASTTSCTSGVGNWFLSADPPTGLSYSNGGPTHSFHTSKTVCGSANSGAGSFTVHWATGNPPQSARYQWTPAGNSASAGFFLYTSFDTATDTIDFYDIFQISPLSESDFAIAQIYDGAMRLESDTQLSSGIPIAGSTLYWVTMQYTAGGTYSLALYDTSTWKQIGSTQTVTGTGTEQPSLIKVGICGSEPEVSGQSVDWDNIVVDTTSGAFPVVP